ncbi:hypothetical protein Tco_0779729 [Tanacetum coccineum]
MTEVEISKEDLYNKSGYPRGSRILYVGLKAHEALSWSLFTALSDCEIDSCEFEWEAIGKIPLFLLFLTLLTSFLLCFGFMFSIEVEALEEDVISVYEAKVLSTSLRQKNTY